MSTIKLKLPFKATTSEADRRSKLFLWAKHGLLNGGEVKVLDEQHFEDRSFIIVENTYRPTPES